MIRLMSRMASKQRDQTGADQFPKMLPSPRCRNADRDFDLICIPTASFGINAVNQLDHSAVAEMDALNVGNQAIQGLAEHGKFFLASISNVNDCVTHTSFVVEPFASVSPDSSGSTRFGRAAIECG